jgi:SAM-dependent methyltransferase
MSDPAVAESFARAAEHYERGRPGWPPEVADVARLPRTATVVDLGAGTGKLTRVLVEKFDKVIAVEPLAGMRELLDDLVPRAHALAGSAEDIPLANAAADGLFCAEAFHWFDGEPAVAEIARVLRPGGPLVLMWNIQSAPTEPSIAPAAELVNERGHSERQIEKYESGAWRGVFQTAPFEELQTATFDHVQTLDREGLLSHLLSMSWIAVLPADELDQLAGDVKPLLTADEYRRPFRSEVHWTRRLEQR